MSSSSPVFGSPASPHDRSNCNDPSAFNPGARKLRAQRRPPRPWHWLLFPVALLLILLNITDAGLPYEIMMFWTMLIGVLEIVFRLRELRERL